MRRNIFYASNTQSELFPHNKRTKFDQYIDIHSLDYIHQNDIEVAVKSVSFDNKRSITVEPNISEPHFVIVQEISKKSRSRYDTFNATKKNKNGNNVGQLLAFNNNRSTLQDYIDINSSKDFIISDCDSKIMIKQNHKKRGFSNIIWIMGQTAIHHIYMHNKEFFYVDRLVRHINNVLKSITFYNDTPSVKKEFITHFSFIDTYNMRSINHRILFHEHLAKILGLTADKISLNQVQTNVFSIYQIEEACEEMGMNNFTSLFYKVVYSAKPFRHYYDIKKTIKSMDVKPKLFGSTLYGVRSNISDPSISSSSYDTLVCMFQDNQKQDVLNIEFLNPTFFKTRKELLSQTHFDISSLESNTIKTENPIGSPTYIQTVVQAAAPRMKRPFSIFLDSSCSKSKNLYPNNTNTDFKIELPERMNFRRNWTVALKTLHLPNKIKNIEECVFKFTRWKPKEGGGLKLLQEIIVPLRNASFLSVDSFVREIINEFRRLNVKISVEMNEERKIVLKYRSIIQDFEMVQIYMSNNLGTILGYTSTPIEPQTLRFDHNKEYIAPHTPNLHLLFPKNLIVACDIADDTIFGGQHVKLLRLITNADNLNSDILSFDFLQDEKVNLGIREFKSIHISILDATGNPVKSESTQPTRLQLMFSLE